MDCIICYNLIIKEKKLDCNHVICTSCYNKLIEYNLLSCPYCRCIINIQPKKKKKINKVQLNIDDYYYRVPIKRRNKRRDLTYDEYLERRHKIKLKYNFRKDRKKIRFNKNN